MDKIEKNSRNKMEKNSVSCFRSQLGRGTVYKLFLNVSLVFKIVLNISLSGML